jgi:tetratricopeptide (TPR) repeat protein
MNTLKTKIAGDEIYTGIRDGFALLDLARGWLQQGNTVVAGELLESAVNSREADRDQDLRARILKEIGRMEMMQSNWEKADSYYLEAQRVFLGIENFQGAAECSRNRANMFFQKGKYDLASDLCEQALEWASSCNNFELRATVLNTLGAVKSATGDLRESIKIFKLCLADFQCAGNRIRQGYVLLNIGLTQTELVEYPEAIASLNEALAVALEEKDLSLVEICYQNISKCYLAQGEVHLARAVLETARKILPGLNSKALETELSLIEGKIQRLMGNYGKAEKVLENTYQMAIEHNMTSLAADILYEQALLAEEKGDYCIAISKLEKAVVLFEQLGVKKAREEALQALEAVRKKAGLMQRG